MNNENLIPIEDLAGRNGTSFSQGEDLRGATAYAGGERIGKIRTALVEPNSGRIRYFVVDAGGWFSNKEVLVPVGLARVEDDAVYFDQLSRDQVNGMRAYRHGEAVSGEHLASDETVLRGREVRHAGDPYDYHDEDTSDRMFKSPQRLQLLEERLTVDKHREKVGEVRVGKHVETRTEQVNVDVSHDEVIIERRPVTDARPTEGARIGADSQSIRVDIEAERADVRKEAYVAEEVEVSKKQERETRTVNEQVGREVLDVERSGGLRVNPNDDDA